MSKSPRDQLGAPEVTAAPPAVKCFEARQVPRRLWLSAALAEAVAQLQKELAT